MQSVESAESVTPIRNMKRKRTGDTEDEHQVCVVRISPLGSGAFGEPAGATEREIAATVARIVQKGMGVDEIRETYNRTISYEMIPIGKGDPESYARGFLRGLTYLRTPTVKDTFHAFDAALVHASSLEAELEPSLASEDDDEEEEVDSSSEEVSSEEDSVSEEDEEDGDDAMVSGNTSESE